jgi:thioredoxin-related protein
MKTRILQIALFCFSVALISGPPSVWAGDAATTNQANIYDESANGDNQVADAVAIAKKEQKRILLKFGANWCAWCHRLHKLFESDKPVSEELRADYVIALIDVNKGHNKDLVVKYGAQAGYGIPFLVVLDSDGTHLITKHCEDFEQGDHHNPQKVLAFLKEWALKQ